MTELTTNNEIEVVQKEQEDMVEETSSNELVTNNETGVVQEELEIEITETSMQQTVEETPKENDFKRGFIFGLGFWAAGALVMSVPFGAILFAVYSVMTTML